MDNVTQSQKPKKKTNYLPLIAVGFAVTLILMFVIYCVWTTFFEFSPGTIRGNVLYVNHEEMSVYSSLEFALADTENEPSSSVPLGSTLSDFLAKGRLVYLKGTTVGITIENVITQEDAEPKSSEDRVVYRVGDYFIAERIG